MDSKLPKPSGLRPPTALVKNMLPTDRIKPSANGGNGLATKTFGAAGSGLSGASYQPLSRDVGNIPNGIRGNRARAISPEPMGAKPKDLQSRAKLRRSRSACDIRSMPLNRKRPVESTVTHTLQSKNTRLGLGGASATTDNTAQRQFRTNNATASTAAKRPITTTRTATATRPFSGSATTATAKDKPKTTVPQATTKRIAPYDFKARFNDLLEKHKALKAKHEKQCESMMELDSLPSQLEETQNKLIQTETDLKNVVIEKECLQRQVNMHVSKIDSITIQLGSTKSQLTELQAEHAKIAAEHAQLSSEVLELRVRSDNLAKSNTELLEELTTCKEQLFQSNMDRKELHNTVMDLRGNIRVFCRVRPPLSNEDDRLLCGWNYQDEATVEIQNLDGLTKHKVGSLTFSFDQVFHPNSEQNDIFEMVSPLIQSALDGYNICIFAYGQTGSGKTYTMDGVPENVGVIPRTVDLLFDSIKNYKNLGWEYEIKVTFLEIYNEVLYDLLSNEQKDMEIRMAKNNKNDIYVSNITEETVTTAGRLRQLMQIAKMNRATASTVGNERSSRSHAVTKLELIGRHAEKQEISIGSINLVDLAGSESPKTSTRMTETKNINRSLSELTNVILALLQKQDHIPYRNSKLTHLLMPSLGGNSKTLMFINVSPFQDCFQESVKSLRFAASVNSCKMSKAKRNRYLNTSNASSSGSL